MSLNLVCCVIFPARMCEYDRGGHKEILQNEEPTQNTKGTNTQHKVTQHEWVHLEQQSSKMAQSAQGTVNMATSEQLHWRNN